MKLRLADGLSLPLETVTQKLAWLGVTGSGKTYGASKLAELFWHAGAQFVVIDPVGVWYGLRLAKDGKKPSGIAIPIVGGLHGDVPLEPTGGELMANLVVDKALSVILDVSQFESDADKARFAKAFADRFFFRKKSQPSAVHLFIEECQEFVPQNPQRGEEQMLHAFIRMQKLGRNFGIGSSYISQRPQEVNKKALNMAQTLFVFRTTGTHERTAIEKWIEDKSLDESIANDLPKIKTGDCHVWSPEFLKISETAHILEKETFNASATPEVGAAAKARELAPIDLDKVRSEMAATIEKAKADDPRELRKLIKELENQIAGKALTAVAVHLEKQKPVLTDVDRALLEKVSEQIAQAASLMHEDLVLAGQRFKNAVDTAMGTYGGEIVAIPARAKKTLDEVFEKARVQKVIDKLTQIQPRTQNTEPLNPQPRRVAPISSNEHRPTRLASAGDITPAKQKILNGLAFLHGIGVTPADKTQLALIIGVSPTSGGYFNNLGTLRSSGLIDYPSGGTVALTVEGLGSASTDGVPSTTRELHEAIRSKLPPAKWKILEALINVYPKSLTKDFLAGLIDVSPTSGGYFNNLGSLRSLGLIDYPRPSEVAALPVLFLE